MLEGGTGGDVGRADVALHLTALFNLDLSVDGFPVNLAGRTDDQVFGRGEKLVRFPVDIRLSDLNGPDDFSGGAYDEFVGNQITLQGAIHHGTTGDVEFARDADATADDEIVGLFLVAHVRRS